MRNKIVALVASAVALLTIAARAQVGAIDPNRSHNEHVHEQEQETRQRYTCRMHPEVITDHPGNCPKCGMKLVPKAEDKRPTSNSAHTMHDANGMEMPQHEHGGHDHEAMQMEMQSSTNIADPMSREGRS